MRVTLPSIRGYVLRVEGDNDRIVRHVSLLFGAGDEGRERRGWIWRATLREQAVIMMIFGR